MITNSLIPCNGRFPTLIALASMFLVIGSGWVSSILSSLVVVGLVIVSIFATFVLSKLLSLTFLRGEPSSFTLELPPYRAPRVWSVIARSVLDRTVFVLGRAASVAAPAGLIIWLLANISVGEGNVLSLLSGILDPVGRFFGMDGVILLAFLLALPAGEIAIPIMLMIYTGGGALAEYASLRELRYVLALNGWTWITALSVSLFTLFHFPCSTTLLTLKKESGKWRYAVLAAVLPTLFGLALCLLVRLVCGIFI